MNQSSHPEDVAWMIIEKCLKRALQAAPGDLDGDGLVAEPADAHGDTLLSRHNLEKIAVWLGMKLDTQLDDVFRFVQGALDDDKLGSYLRQEAPGITIALDRQSPRVTFVAAA